MRPIQKEANKARIEAERAEASQQNTISKLFSLILMVGTQHKPVSGQNVVFQQRSDMCMTVPLSKAISDGLF